MGCSIPNACILDVFCNDCLNIKIKCKTKCCSSMVPTVYGNRCNTCKEIREKMITSSSESNSSATMMLDVLYHATDEQHNEIVESDIVIRYPVPLHVGDLLNSTDDLRWFVYRDFEPCQQCRDYCGLGKSYEVVSITVVKI